MKIKYRNGKWQFDQAIETLNWDEEEFDRMVDRTIKNLDAAEKNEFWRQFNEWKRQTQQ